MTVKISNVDHGAFLERRELDHNLLRREHPASLQDLWRLLLGGLLLVRYSHALGARARRSSSTVANAAGATASTLAASAVLATAGMAGAWRGSF